MAAVDLESEEKKEFECYRLSGAGIPPDDKEALAFFRGLKKLAFASYCDNAVEEKFLME